MKNQLFLVFVKSLGFCLSKLPYPILEKLTESLAFVLSRVPNARWRLLLSNLSHGFPCWSLSKIKSVAFESSARMFEMGFFSLCYPFMSGEERRQTVFYNEGTANKLMELRSSGRPVLILIPHTCLFETLATSPLFRPFGGKSLGAIYRPNKNPMLDEWITKAREKVGIKTFSRKEGIIRARIHLKEGNWLALLYDQNAGNRGTGAKFLGRICSVSPLPDLLSKNKGVICVHAIAGRVSFFRTKLELKILDYKESNVTGKCHNLLASHMMGCSRGFPEWLWSHGKWKINNMSHEYFQLQNKFGHLSFDERKDRANRLAIRMPNWLGDIVMSIPLILAIKKGRPDLWISLYCMNQYSEWLRSLGIADEILELPVKKSFLGYFFKFISFRNCFIDAQLLFTHSLRGDIESFLVGAENRFGLVRDHCRPLLTDFYKSEEGFSTKLHQINIWEKMLNQFGLREELLLTPLSIPDRLQSDSVDLITIGIAPGSMNTPEKRLPVSEWIKICRGIQQGLHKLKIEFKVELFGTSKDRQICSEIVDHLSVMNIQDYSGNTTLVQLSEKFKDLDLLICNDSGAMHLANLLGVPIIAIFGQTNPLITGPIFNGVVKIIEQSQIGKLSHPECDAIINQTLSNAKTNIY
jgi:ADP-heptose:LPS heptosyltransferase/lauroyl/myristoyl acyltransferase